MLKNVELIGKNVIEDYIKAFNERDSIKMADLFNFPHVRFANDNVSVISKSEYLSNQEKVTKLLKNENWHHTEIKEIKNIQSSETKVHFIIHFLRLDKDRVVEEVVIRFKMPNKNKKYHFPIILSPNSYSIWWSEGE